MGGDSDSSNVTNNTTTNTSGSIATQGPNNGAQISGVNGSNIEVNMSDHGAVEGSLDLAGDVVGSMESVANNAIDKNNDLLESMLDSNKDVIDNVLDNNNDLFEGALDSVNSSAGQAATNAKETLNFAKELASNAMTGGQAETQKQIVLVVGSLILVGGLVLSIKAWKG
ncbi:hypothetical protein M2H12_14935 [Vibrio vulnificus]|nr:hypothetical protein [Vibrio vulnificus]MCU8166995.1 hypothetical protein [Vibrio vulnificus]MCU8171434.1 hypothetical protein [Vibrio vulnificus]MCU8266206.1 hypothetical protein [Vibrio vulnificus]